MPSVNPLEHAATGTLYSIMAVCISGLTATVCSDEHTKNFLDTHSLNCSVQLSLLLMKSCAEYNKTVTAHVTPRVKTNNRRGDLHPHHTGAWIISEDSTPITGTKERTTASSQRTSEESSDENRGQRATCLATDRAALVTQLEETPKPQTSGSSIEIYPPKPP